MFFKMFILSTFLFTQPYHFVQLQVGLNAFPSPPRLCPRVRQQYLYNNILNKCKERKLHATPTIKVYTFLRIK